MKLGQTISPRKLAGALGVSESSVKRWCDQGILPSTRTPGGHRRIPIQVAVDFARKNGKSISHPELLGLPASVRYGVAKELLPRFAQALISGDEAASREMMRGFCFDPSGITSAFDELLTPALHLISAGCEDGSVKLYEERKSWSIVSTILAEVRLKIIASSLDGPLVCGGALCRETPSGDVQMAEIVLRNEGWHAVSYGNDCSVELLVAVARDCKPEAVWLNVFGRADFSRFAGRIEALARELAAVEIPLFVIGTTVENGSGLPEGVVVCTSHVDMVKQFSELRTHAKSIVPAT